MANVRVYKANRGHPFWQHVAQFIRDKGYPVDTDKSEADVSIVLSGRFENPLIFKGKKVMAYDAMEWLRNVPLPWGFNAYKEILEEYYDDFIDLTNLNVEERVEKIIEYIKGEECLKDAK